MLDAEAYLYIGDIGTVQLLLLSFILAQSSSLGMGGWDLITHDLHGKML